MFVDCDSLDILNFNRADLNSGRSMFSRFQPTNLTVYVKDETSKNFVLSELMNTTVIIEPLTA